MTHSHDRTLLASLGFADPDKKNPRHDFGCQYLALSLNHTRLASMVVEGLTKETRRRKYQQEPEPFLRRNDSSFDIPCLGQVRLEFPITKGEGKYRSTVGFTDAVLIAFANERMVATEDDKARFVEMKFDEQAQRKALSCQTPFVIAVEVKIAKVGVGDIIRQIGLYRDYTDGRDQALFKYWEGEPQEREGYYQPPTPKEVLWGMWVVATDYRISPEDKAVLANERIIHIRLGPKFDEYVTARNASKTESNSEEF